MPNYVLPYIPVYYFLRNCLGNSQRAAWGQRQFGDPWLQVGTVGHGVVRGLAEV